jgi:CO/xanthine dehydrogenase FAD-binding subunit
MLREYLSPRSVDEALELLKRRAGQARLIAGGTDLMLQLRRGERCVESLVDISGIDALQAISANDGYITLGAAATHAAVASSRLIRECAPVLAQAAAEVGAPEIRNVATLGGNVVNAQPAADTALAFLALDAEAEIVNMDGARWVALPDLYRGVGVSAVDSTSELVTAFRFRLPAGQTGSAYRRLGKCKSIALPVLCAATVVRLDGECVAQAAISLGPVAPRPFRARAAEALLAGQPVGSDIVSRAAAQAQREAKPRDSLLRCARDYREAMVAVLVQSTLEKAIADARLPAGRAS